MYGEDRSWIEKREVWVKEKCGGFQNDPSSWPWSFQWSQKSNARYKCGSFDLNSATWLTWSDYLKPWSQSPLAPWAGKPKASRCPGAPRADIWIMYIFLNLVNHLPVCFLYGWSMRYVVPPRSFFRTIGFNLPVAENAASKKPAALISQKPPCSKSQV